MKNTRIKGRLCIPIRMNFQKVSLSKSYVPTFPPKNKKGGGGQMLFETFLKIHAFWRAQPFLSLCLVTVLSCEGVQVSFPESRSLIEKVEITWWRGVHSLKKEKEEEKITWWRGVHSLKKGKKERNKLASSKLR